MASCFVGAQSFERQDFSCVIRMIECHYTDGDDKPKDVVLYSRETSLLRRAKVQAVEQRGSSQEGVQRGGIDNSPDKEFYFITNKDGKDITLSCKRETNRCSQKEHNQYVVDSIDIHTRELQSEVKDLSDGTLTLYYYDLFTRTGKYAQTGFTKGAEYGRVGGGAVSEVTGRTLGGVADAFISGDPNEHRGSEIGGAVCRPIGEGVGAVGGAAIGGIGGAAVGNVADIIAALRFITLPRIRNNDYDYECHTYLEYHECPHLPSVPHITIYHYPDIEFKLEIGFLGIKNKYGASSANKDKREQTDFSIDFSVMYANVTKNLGFERVNEKELNAEEQKGFLFYKTINALATFFKESANFADSLKKEIEQIYGEENSITKDVGFVGKALEKVSTLPKWISSSISVEPSLVGTWRYSVSDDITKIGKFIEVELGVDCKGELILDLIEIGKTLLKKTKDATTVAAAATTVASGGLAGVPALVVKFLVDTVVKWMIEKLKDGVHLDLKIIGSANLKAFKLTWDTSKDKIFEGKGEKLELRLEIRLESGVEYNTSISVLVTVKGNVNASAQAAISITWEIQLSVKHGLLGVDSEVSVNPFSVKVGYAVAGSFEIFGYSIGSSHSKCYERKAKERKTDPVRWDWFKLYDAPTADGAGGGGASSW